MAMRARLMVGVLGAFLALGAGEARADGVAVAAANDEQKQAAQTAFLEALEKGKAGDHEGALTGFRASFDVVASPNTKLMIGRELAALGKLADAYREIKSAERLAQEAAVVDPKYADAASAAGAEAAEMQKRIGMLSVDLAGRPTLELTVAGRVVPREDYGTAVAVDPGEVEVSLRGPSGVDVKKVTVEAGTQPSVSFADTVIPPPPPPKEEPSTGFNPFDGGSDQRITAYVAGGVGATGMILFGVFGGLHLSTYGDLEDQCPGGRCPASLAGDADSGQTYQTVANVGLVVGIVGLAAGTALFVTTLGGDDETAQNPVHFGVGPGGFSVEGSF